MATFDKVRVIVAGDSGVGKTSLTSLIANQEPLTSPGWTIGCSVEARLHEYKEGTTAQATYFVELWDVGGSLSHRNARGVFFTPTHGIILVHDLTNRKSHENLQRWLCEILNKDGKDASKAGSSSIDMSDFDPEDFLGTTQFKKLQVPILVMGTKMDLLDENQRAKFLQRSSTGGIAEQCGAEEICLNCHNSRSLAAGTTDAIKLSRFFDRIIEQKYFSKESNIFNERRKYVTPYTSPLTSPFVSPFGPFASSTMTNQSE